MVLQSIEKNKIVEKDRGIDLNKDNKPKKDKEKQCC